MIRGESMRKEEVQETDDNNHEEHHTKYNGLWGETLLQLKNRLVYSRRSKNMICIYCGENAQTREHCPPRSFFPEHDFPDNLRVLPACEQFNKGFSHDEEIVMDFLNCAYDFLCKKVANGEYSLSIKEGIELTEKSKWPIAEAEKIFAKVAQGLAIYEMAECFGDYDWMPKMTDYICKHWITQKEWENLKQPVTIDAFPELGTRASDGFFIFQIDSDSIDSCSVMWTELKEDVFSYVTWMQDGFIKVRMIIRDFFYVEVSFYNED